MASRTQPTRIGRRGITKGDRRQEAILDASEELLAEKAWHEISIDDIAERAKMSRSTFYFYYDSRNSLLGALLERVLEQTGQHPRDSWVSRPPDVRPLVALRTTFSHVLGQWTDHGAVLAQAANLWSSIPELRDQWDRLQAQAIEEAAAQIERERRLGKAPPGLDAMKLSTSLMWMSERVLSILTTDSSTALPREDLVETLAFVWVRTIYLDDDPEP